MTDTPNIITVTIKTEHHNELAILRKAATARCIIGMKIEPLYELSTYGSLPGHNVSVSFLDAKCASEFLLSCFHDDEKMTQFKLFWSGE